MKSKWNFSLVDKRVLNFDNEVSDSDNIKQDLSIDVYGRAEKAEAEAKAAEAQGASSGNGAAENGNGASSNGSNGSKVCFQVKNDENRIGLGGRKLEFMVCSRW